MSKHQQTRSRALMRHQHIEHLRKAIRLIRETIPSQRAFDVYPVEFHRIRALCDEALSEVYAKGLPAAFAGPAITPERDHRGLFVSAK